MAQLLEKLFGALGKESCLYFYILSVIGLIFVAVILFSAIVIGISKKNPPQILCVYK